MKKRFLALFLAFVMALVLLPTAALAADSDFVIENGTLHRYRGKGGAVTIPSGVIYIALGAFRGCESLKSVTIPSSMIRIGGYAFEGCTGLESVTIPSSVTSIGWGAFAGCTSLTAIQVEAGNRVYTSVDGLLFTKDKKTLVVYPGGKQGAYTVPSSVTSIEDQAFAGCTGLTGVTIPDSITSIGGFTFTDCTGLKSVTIPDGVTSIGDAMFQGCTGLESVTIPDSVTSIGEWAFRRCTSLKSVTIPNGVTSIGENAFIGCTGLTSVTIPNSVTEIGDRAFSGCIGLKSITIPDSVTNIGDSAFSGCSSLKSVTIPSGVTSVADSAFSNCTGLTAIQVEAGNPNYTSVDGVLLTKDGKALVVYPSGKQGAYTVPSSVTRIRNAMFHGCVGLTSVTIPDSVTGIGQEAFRGCTSLKSVTIPSSVTDIQYLAFEDCTVLTDIYYGGTESQWKAISIQAYSNEFTSATIHYNSTMPGQAAPVAYPNTVTVTINGTPVEFQMYALKDEKGSNTSYIKIRDLAKALKGTEAEFNIDRANGVITFTGGAVYTPNGSEDKTPYSGPQTYMDQSGDMNVNGALRSIDAFMISHSTGGYTYFKLEDVAKALDFNVGWSKARGSFIETDKPYTGK